MKRFQINIPASPLHVCAILLTFGGVIFTVFAVPLYTPGQTLEPACAPGATDCTVSVGGGDYADGGEAGTADRTLGNTDNFDLGLETNDTTRLHIEGGGNVGIGTTSPTSVLHVEGSLSLQQATVTGNTTLDNTHNVVFANPTGNITITLPAAASHTDKVYYIKKIDGDNDEVTIDGNASETIDGTTTLVLYIQYDAVRIISTGTAWHIISDEIQPHVASMTRDTPGQVVAYDDKVIVDFNNVEFDTAGISDISTTLADRFTVKRAGRYQINAYVYFSGPDSGERVNGYFHVNGDTNSGLYMTENVSRSNGEGAVLLTRVMDLSATDYVEFYIKHLENAGNLTTDVSDFLKPKFSIHEIR